MKRCALLFLAMSLVLPACNRQTAQAQTATEDREVELTVYSQDFAQVNEQRTVDLSDGTTRVRINDVSHLLDQDTVNYDFADGSSQVVSTIYDLGSLSGQDLLSNLVGKQVDLVYRGESGREGERQRGVLEVATPGNIVVRVGEKLIVNPNATIEAPAGEVATMPQLSASVESDKPGKKPMNFSYMTRGLAWSASYVLNLAPGADEAEIELWATVTNSTGIDYPAAKIKFVAGAPNRAVVPTAESKRRDYDLEERSYPAAIAGDAGIRFDANPIAVGELIAYPYESKATLRNNQTNRVLMMQANKVKIVRDYAINLGNHYYYHQDNDQRLKATLSLALKNEKESGLGQPLPMGTIRVYEKSVAIGASQIGNTPEGDRIDMTLTEVFNVYARQKTIETKKLDKRRTQTTYEVVVYNEKDADLDVRLVRDFYGTWSIASESQKSTRPNSGQAQWILSVPAGESTKLTYSVITG
jgi:hypothetical protein